MIHELWHAMRLHHLQATEVWACVSLLCLYNYDILCAYDRVCVI